MGPTAVGKTAFAVKLVEKFPFEIISVDSALVYRGMDIGTAKPDATTLHRAPHRLIDFLDPSDVYSAARFRADALREINDIHSKGRIPLLVGGTMLYYRVLEQGLAELPGADPTLRTYLDNQRSLFGLAAFHAQLAAVDPVAAQRIHPNDPQRIQRALEVYYLTGRTLTELYAQSQDQQNLFQCFKIVLAPLQREFLHQRIEQRFYDMLEQGFIEEVKNLFNRKDLSLDKPAIRSVGYRQIWEYLEGVTGYAEMTKRGIAATRQLAKRQITWLRSEKDGLWLDSQATSAWNHLLTYLNENALLPK
jgi:tRNA dimethylallyltransferase